MQPMLQDTPLRGRFVRARLKTLCDAASDNPSASKKLQHHLRFTFRGVEFAGKTVLDVGGGNGLHSFYAALAGAKRVVCLEPGAAGCNDGCREFQQLAETCGIERESVCQLPTTLQDFAAESASFDVILLHNSVNHLDENACIQLQQDANSRGVYLSLFEKLGQLAAENAELIVCDCSRYNFWNLLGVASPFAPSIEWHKHQSPKCWAELLESQGFQTRRVRWSTPNALGSLGQFALGYKAAAYFLSSHFCLTMRYRNSASQPI